MYLGTEIYIWNQNILYLKSNFKHLVTKSHFLKVFLIYRKFNLNIFANFLKRLYIHF